MVGLSRTYIAQSSQLQQTAAKLSISKRFAITDLVMATLVLQRASGATRSQRNTASCLEQDRMIVVAKRCSDCRWLGVACH